MANVSAPVRRYLILLRNTGATIADLPPAAWMLAETVQGESEARSRYFAMRSFLEQRDAPCLVVESVKPVLGPEELRILISRSAVLEKGRIPDPVRLSRDQAAFLARAIEESRARDIAATGRQRARPRHAGFWASAFAGFVVTMIGATGLTLWLRAPAATTEAASPDQSAARPPGSLVVLPDGNSGDRFVVFRLRPDGTRTDERRISKAEYDEMQSRGGRTFREREAGASRMSSLAERTSMFARFRAAD